MKRQKRIRLLLASAVLLVACGILPTPPPTLPPSASETPSAATDTPAPAPSETLLPSSTLLPTGTPTATTVPTMIITVYFTDQNAYVVGTPPFEVGVTRTVPYSPGIARAVLTEFFNGPTPAEAAAGLVLITSGATGFSNLTITDTIARVYLIGPCNSQGATYTVAGPLLANLLQFSTVSYVKIYDHNGDTEQPTGYTNSIPVCLEP